MLAAPGPMALWAFVVMALTALGMATMLLGLVVIVPLLAHFVLGERLSGNVLVGGVIIIVGIVVAVR